MLELFSGRVRVGVLVVKRKMSCKTCNILYSQTASTFSIITMPQRYQQILPTQPGGASASSKLRPQISTSFPEFGAASRAQPDCYNKFPPCKEPKPLNLLHIPSTYLLEDPRHPPLLIIFENRNVCWAFCSLCLRDCYPS